MGLTVYQASAGSGKTYRLALEYLKYAFTSNNSYREILAITFTNKAANELKERIIKNVKECADINTHSNFAHSLMEETGKSADQLAADAKRMLSSMLHNYSAISVSTIDSFTNRIIRSFARELHLNPDFDVELDTQLVYQELSEKLLSKAGNDKELTAILLQWVSSLTDNNEKAQGIISKDLANYIGNLNSEDVYAYKSSIANINHQDLAKQLKDINAYVQSFEAQLAEIKNQLSRIYTAHNLTVDDLQGKSTSNFFKLTQNFNDSWWDTTEGICAEIIPRFEKLLDQANNNKIEKTGGTATAEIQELLSESLSKVLASKPQYESCKVLIPQAFILHFSQYIFSALKDWADNSNKVLIADFNTKISDVLLNEPVPFIYEMVGNRYKYLLIDEFQDTSVLNWQNMVPLAHEAISKMGETVIVGDAKQSIYRFRGGEANLITDLPNLSLLNKNASSIAEAEKQFVNHFENKNMEMNFRSRKEVVHFNNSLVDFLQKTVPSQYQKVFENGNQQVVNQKTGFVKLNIAEAKSKKEVLEPWNRELLFQDLNELKNKGYAWSDIAILVRTGSIADTIISWFNEAPVGAHGYAPVLAADNLLVTQNPLCKMLLSIAHLVVNNRDQTAMATLSALWVEMNSDISHIDFTQTYITPVKTETQRFNQFKLADFFSTHLPDLNIKQLQLSNVFECFQLVSNALLNTFNHQPDIYLQTLLDKVISLSNRGKNDLASVCTYFTENPKKLSVELSENTDAIKIMTIHKSKGLEFNTVIVPFLNWTGNNNPKLKWVADDTLNGLGGIPISLTKKELNGTRFNQFNEQEKETDIFDNATNLYVAFTRAEQNLIAYGAAGHGTQEPLKSYFTHCETLPEFDEENKCLTHGELLPNDQVKMLSNNPIGLYSTDKNKNIKVQLDTERTEFREAEIGNIVHHILMSVIHPEDLNAVKESTTLPPQFTETEKLTIWNKVEEAVETGIQEGWIAENCMVRNEMTISAFGEIKRPDRVTVSEENTWVIDYKTGQPELMHEEQINTYANLLEQAGFENVKTRLVYL